MMDDLISREAAIKAIEEEWDGACSEYPAGQIINETQRAIDCIDSVPAVAVVRCTACRNWNRESGLTARMCSNWGKFTKQFDYCSYGEEQDEADRP